MLTEEQRRAVEGRGKIIVSASAGSGKTFVMIERLVSLILEGTPVREVLAVTFTNKAAAQMRERLRSALLAKLSETKDDGARERLKQNLTDLPLADISTIHAFCARLIRTHFYIAGVDPAFRIISPDDAEGKALSARAQSEAFELEYEEGGEDFRRLLSVYFRKKKDTHLREIILSLYEKAREHADYRSILAEAGTKDDFKGLCAYLERDFKERLSEIVRRAEAVGEFFALIEGKQGKRMSDEVASAARALCACKGLFAMTAAAALDPAISRSPAATKAGEEEYRHIMRLRALAEEVKGIYAELQSYGAEDEELARCLDAQERAHALAVVALRYDEIYTRLKREAGVLDYNDLEHFALAVLSDEGAREEIVGRYRYVFVDEYQDVNPAQEQILSLLSGEEVFLVGDGKQAIYGFRGSKSEYFYDKIWGEKPFPHALELTANFRSAPAVLDAVNRVFAPIAVKYQPMHGDRYGEHKGKVVFHAVKAKEKPEREERGVYSVLGTHASPETDALAEAVVRAVRGELGKLWWDADAGAERIVSYGDIAVLTRKNTGDAARIVGVLSELNIPVTTSSKVNVCDFFEARLLLDWLSYLDNAEQDVPLATAMLSAIGGFTDADLASIRLQFPRCPTFREAARSYARGGDPLAKRLKGFFARVENYRALCAVRTAAEMLGLLLADGLEVQIAAKGDGANRLARVRRLTGEAEGGSVHTFLKRLAAGGYQIDFAESGGENAVKVLTMHASKGLEYPVVILAGLDAPFHGADTREEVMWTDVSSRELYAKEDAAQVCLLAPRSYDVEQKLVYTNILRRVSEIAQDRASVSEERNLLYVAMTRAKYRLHLFVKEGEHAYNPTRANRFAEFMDLDAFKAAGYFEEEREAAEPALGREWLPQAGSTAKKEEILAVYKKQYAHFDSTCLPVKSSATELMREGHGAFGGETPSFRGAPFRAGASVEEGLAYHAFLENVRFGRSAEEEIARMGSENLLTEEQIALLDAEKLKEILALPCFRDLDGRRVCREQKFLVLIPACEVYDTEERDEIVFQGAIDLLVERDEGYEVIDYKFSARSDDALRATYAVQIDLYRRAVARTLGVKLESVRARIVNILQCREIVL